MALPSVEPAVKVVVAWPFASVRTDVGLTLPPVGVKVTSRPGIGLPSASVAVAVTCVVSPYPRSVVVGGVTAMVAAVVMSAWVVAVLELRMYLSASAPLRARPWTVTVLPVPGSGVSNVAVAPDVFRVTSSLPWTPVSEPPVIVAAVVPS